MLATCLLFALFLGVQPRTAAEGMDDKVYLYINLWHNRIYLKDEEDNILYSYRIAPGAKDTPSPVGVFRVIHKSKNWGGGFGSRWLGLNVSWGTYGIHGTNKPESIGRYASHGCFRMRNKDIEKLYEMVPLGATVVIDGPIMGHEDLTYRILVPGSKGALVQLVQNRLRAAGYYHGKTHGIFDRQTEQAVIRFQKKEKLEVTGQIHPVDLTHLGIIE
ncbi:MAG: L,D-transpeptidase family protein [Brevibacillus sp.]|nr:L,D-transpeptidase family protein [Brevibacillus sp.]